MLKFNQSNLASNKDEKENFVLSSYYLAKEKLDDDKIFTALQNFVNKALSFEPNSKKKNAILDFYQKNHQQITNLIYVRNTEPNCREQCEVTLLGMRKKLEKSLEELQDKQARLNINHVKR